MEISGKYLARDRNRSYNEIESFVLGCMTNGGTWERDLIDWFPVLGLLANFLSPANRSFSDYSS